MSTNLSCCLGARPYFGTYCGFLRENGIAGSVVLTIEARSLVDDSLRELEGYGQRSLRDLE